MTKKVIQIGAYIEVEEGTARAAQVGAYIEVFDEKRIVVSQIGAYIEVDEPEEEDKFGPRIQVI